jgi:transcriptional regulator with XRE-family HTH domain
MTNLKHALVDHPGPAYRVAQKLGISDSRLSKIVIGLVEPNKEEKTGLVAIFGVRVEELFCNAKDN